jgi:hypothetical protein
MKLTLFASLASTLLMSSLVVSSAIAQGNYRGNDQRNNNSSSDYITIYEHCDFRGDSRDVLVGDFRNMRSVNFRNDSVSSVKVPNGMDLVIYQDDDFRGGYARINQNISCFDRQWNDKVSSLKVSGYVSNRRNDRGDDRGYDGRDYDNRGRDNDRGDRSNRGNRNSNVNAKNVSKVVFDGKVLQQTDRTNWRMDSQRGGVSQFKEVRRDRDSVYLQNDYTAEKVRIDLFANDVTFINRSGRQQRYNIQNKKATLTSRPPARTPHTVDNRRIRQECFDYRATSNGGEASVRFQTRESLKRFNNQTVTGRVCHNGSLLMQIGKRNANTKVVIEILGRSFRFDRNEKETSYQNNWYRKDVTLSVGR